MTVNYANYPYKYITDNYLVQLSEFSHQIKPHWWELCTMQGLAVLILALSTYLLAIFHNQMIMISFFDKSYHAKKP